MLKQWSWRACAGAVLLASAIHGRAAIITINPSDDAALYVCDGCNLVSNGAYLLVAGYIQGAVKFPMAAISDPVANARLSVNPYGLPLWGPTVDVYGFESTSGLIDSASANAGSFLGTLTLPPDLGYGQDAFFDVTAFVAGAKSPYVGFNLRDSGGADVFSSIEYNYGHPAQLIVTTVAQVPVPQPVPTGSPLAILALVVAAAAVAFARLRC